MGLKVKCIKIYLSKALRCCYTVLMAFCLAPFLACAEDTFPVLTVGSDTYSNVTVTTKTPRFVVIMHAQGMTSLKLKDLSPELLTQLGYKVETPKPKKSLSQQINIDPRLIEMQQKAAEEIESRLRQLDPRLIGIALSALLVLYLFFCYCSMLICHRVGQAPGVLVWIPVLQFFPLLRAAGMSAWWFLLLLLASPVVGIVWCVKICRARGKSLWVAICLLLPVTDLFAFLYLAFADGPRKDSSSERITFN